MDRLDGLLVLDKPGGMTSRDAVDIVQRWLPRGTKVGHTGTLDPLATGVLVVCLGMATRLAEFVQEMSKAYRAGVILGATSDTDDADGVVTPVAGAVPPDLGAVQAALAEQVGTIDQVPPAYSAARVTGQRAYALARRGREVTLAPRPVNVYKIDILAYDYPRLELAVECGKGTYIRSLARDVGQRLGCGGHIGSLRRTRVGPFHADGALGLVRPPADLAAALLPLDSAVAELERLPVNEREAQLLNWGRPLPCPNPKGTAAAFDPQGQLVAVVRYDEARQAWRPYKVFTGGH